MGFPPVEELVDQPPTVYHELGALSTKTLVRNWFRLCGPGDVGALGYVYADAGNSSAWRYVERATDWACAPHEIF